MVKTVRRDSVDPGRTTPDARSSLPLRRQMAKPRAVLRSRAHRPATLVTAIFSTVLSLVVAVATSRAAELESDDLFDAQKLLDVEITLPANDWETLRKQSRTNAGFAAIFTETIEKPFTYFQGDITINGVKVSSVGIRKKGFFGSIDETRPSLKVKFSEFQEQQPVNGLDRLTLNNNKQDTTLVSQLLSYHLFTKAGVPAPRCSLAKVTVNGEYLGIYSNVESYKAPFLTRRFGDASGNLFEGTVADFHPRALGRIEAKSGSAAAQDPDVQRLAELLATAEAPQLEDLEALVDIDNFLRYWAVESLIGFWDGYTQNQNNYFVYDNPQDGKFYFMPWGADCCFDPAGSPFGQFQGGPRTVSIRAESLLAHRLFTIEGIPDRYRKTMQHLLAEVWDEESLLAEVARVQSLTRGKLHARQESGRAGLWGPRPLTANRLREFIRDRRTAIQAELDRWPVDIPARPRKPVYTTVVGSAQGSLRATWAAKSLTEDPGEVTDFTLRIDDEEVPLKQMTAKANPLATFGFGGPSARPPRATIVLSGIRSTDDRELTLTMILDRQAMQQAQVPTEVSGSLSYGRSSGFGFGPPRTGPMLRGTLTFSQVGTEDGSELRANFELQITELRGWITDMGGDRGRR